MNPRRTPPSTTNPRTPSSTNPRRILFFIAPRRNTFSISHPKTPRHIYFLLACALFLPLFAELIQKLLIGETQISHSSDNHSNFLQLRITIAQFLRPLSNLLIGGSMVAGIGLALYSAVIAKRKIAPQLAPRASSKPQPKNKPQLTKRKTRPGITPDFRRNLFLLTVVFFTTYIVCILVAMLGFFILRNDWYWYGRPWTGGGLYDGAWYNFHHWRIMIFH